MTDLRTAMADTSLQPLLVARDIAVTGVTAVTPEDSLNMALQLMADVNVRELPVVEREEPGRIISIVSRKDITRAYHNEMERRSTHKTGGTGNKAGVR
jgi:CIC family chloride channel protein